MLNVAKINLSFLKENAIKIKNTLPKTTKLCAVVKADGYGHGAVEVANAIYSIADCFAVAIIEEAIALRIGGIDKEILVLTEIFGEDIERGIEEDLTFTVYNYENLKEISRLAKRLNKKVKLHLKIETGMNRQGILQKDLPKFLRYIQKSPWLNLSGAYSHFAMPENKRKRETQESKFILALNVIKRYNKDITAHISASGGFLKGCYFDMVRIGIMLYGYKPFPAKISLKKVMRVYSYKLCDKMVKKGESVLYGDCELNSDKNYSLIRFGYADGLPRLKTNGDINNRCMDISAVKCVAKRRVAIMDDAKKTAKQYGTICYEVLVNVTKRAERVYVD